MSVGGQVLEGLAVAVAEQAVLADAGEEEVDLAIGVEVGGRDAQAGLVQRQAERGRGVLESAVSLVQQEGVAQALGADDRRGQVEVELAVAVDVEGGDRRAEAGADPADHGAVALEVVGRGPAIAVGELDRQAAWPARTSAGSPADRSAVAGRGKGLITVAYLPISP